MAKRFTDNTIWQKAWFRKLATKDKCAFNYIKDNCDSVGVWDADYELADFCIGENIEWNNFIDKCNGNIEILKNGKLWLKDFCNFQYGNLNSEESLKNKARLSYINLLKKHNLWEKYCNLDYSKTSNRGQEEVQEKEKEKEKDKEKEKEKKAIEEIYNLYPSICPIKKSSTNKCKKNKDQISKLLKEKEKGDIIKTINEYIEDCKKNKIWIKNFSTFLNQFPEKENYDIKNMSVEEVEKLLDEGKIQ